MADLFTKYISAKGDKVNRLRVRLYYDLGGINYFTYKNEPRGYYLSVTPEEVSDRGNGFICVSTTMFSGIKALVKNVQRQSKKSAEEAIKLAEPKIQQLVDYVCNKEGIEVLE